MLKKICAVLFLCAALGVVPCTVWAKNPNTAPAVAKFAQDSNAKLVYIGRRHSVDMWLAVKDGTMQTLYSTPDGQGMLMNGMLFSPDGKLANEDMITEFGEKNPDVIKSLSDDLADIDVDNVESVGEKADLANPAAASKTTVADVARELKPSERLWDDLSQANLLSFGSKAAPVVFAFVDPRCGHCDSFWQKIAPTYVAKGQVNLQLVPVGILGPESVELAARILGAKDPTQAWLDLKAGKTLGTDEISPDGQIKLAQNGDMMAKWKIQSTPFLVYRNKAGTVRLLRGGPEKMDSLLADMGIDSASKQD